MSFVSYGSFTAVTTQYIGSASRSGFEPYFASSAAACSSASGCCRNFSHGAGASGGSGPAAGGASNFPLQRHGAFAAKIERLQRVELARIRNADAHAQSASSRSDRKRSPPCGHSRAAVPSAAIQIGQDRGRLHRLRREHERCTRSPVTFRLRNRSAIARDQCGTHAVVRPRPLHVSFDDLATRRLPRLDRRMDARDRGLFNPKPQRSAADAADEKSRATAYHLPSPPRVTMFI